MQWCDIGVNLTDKRFGKDLPEVIAAARQANVDQLIITGTSVSRSQEALAICRAFPDTCYCTTGVHPHDAKDAPEDLQQQLITLSAHPEVVAIGECGLDYNRNFSEPQVQRKVFAAQLEVAVTTQLPVFLHERDAFDDQVALLSQYRSRMSGGVVHCFTGNQTQLQTYLDMDFYIGITGWLCDPKRGQALREAVPHLPLERVLLETDAPYLTPKTLNKGKGRNQPANLPHIAEQLASLMGCSVQQLSEASWQNTRRLFALQAR